MTYYRNLSVSRKIIEPGLNMPEACIVRYGVCIVGMEYGSLSVHCRVQECIRTRVRACNYVKFETGRNLPPVLKIVTRHVHAALT